MSVLTVNFVPGTDRYTFVSTVWRRIYLPPGFFRGGGLASLRQRVLFGEPHKILKRKKKNSAAASLSLPLFSPGSLYLAKKIHSNRKSKASRNI